MNTLLIGIILSVIDECIVPWPVYHDTHNMRWSHVSVLIPSCSLPSPHTCVSSTRHLPVHPPSISCGIIVLTSMGVPALGPSGFSLNSLESRLHTHIRHSCRHSCQPTFCFWLYDSACCQQALNLLIVFTALFFCPALSYFTHEIHCYRKLHVQYASCYRINTFDISF